MLIPAGGAHRPHAIGEGVLAGTALGGNVGQPLRNVAVPVSLAVCSECFCMSGLHKVRTVPLARRSNEGPDSPQNRMGDALVLGTGC